MRKKRKIKTKIFFGLFLMMLSLSVSYAMLSTNINIRGTVVGNYNDSFIVDKDSNPNLEISGLVSQSSWQEGDTYKYQLRFPLKNIGNDAYDNFKLTLTFDTEILSVTIWNFEYEINGKNLIIKSSNNINPNQEIEINFIVEILNSSIKITKVKLETITTGNEIDSSLFLVNFVISNGWGNYTYQYDVTVTNNTGQQVTYWQLTVELPEGTTHQGGWSAIFSTNNNLLVIKNESHNGKLNHDQSISFGLQLNTNIQNFVPTEYTVVVR